MMARPRSVGLALRAQGPERRGVRMTPARARLPHLISLHIRRNLSVVAMFLF